MSKLEKVEKSLDALHSKLNYAVHALQEMEDSVSAKELALEERMRYLEYRKLLEWLSDSKAVLEYLNKPVVREGTLYKNENGRYELSDRELTSGSQVEVFICDEFYECDMWVKTSVEHADGDYYLVGHKNVPMQGLQARTRW